MVDRLGSIPELNSNIIGKKSVLEITLRAYELRGHHTSLPL